MDDGKVLNESCTRLPGAGNLSMNLKIIKSAAPSKEEKKRSNSLKGAEWSVAKVAVEILLTQIKTRVKESTQKAEGGKNISRPNPLLETLLSARSDRYFIHTQILLLAASIHEWHMNLSAQDTAHKR